MSGWIGVDFDGTLATYDGWKGPAVLGEPVGDMVFRVKKWLADGRAVKIFTARAYPVVNYFEGHGTLLPGHPEDGVKQSFEAIDAIVAWCKEHIGRELPITCVKDFAMIELYDDRAVQVEENTGRLVGRSTRGL